MTTPIQIDAYTGISLRSIKAKAKAIQTQLDIKRHRALDAAAFLTHYHTVTLAALSSRANTYNDDFYEQPYDLSRLSEFRRALYVCRLIEADQKIIDVGKSYGIGAWNDLCEQAWTQTDTHSLTNKAGRTIKLEVSAEALSCHDIHPGECFEIEVNQNGSTRTYLLNYSRSPLPPRPSVFQVSREEAVVDLLSPYEDKQTFLTIGMLLGELAIMDRWLALKP